MKKIIKSAFVLALMALTFTSCEDVPAPFDTNYNEQGETSNVEPAGDGTEASPYNVARVLEIVKAGEQTTDMVYLKGVITNIKEIDTNQFGNATFSISDTKNGMTTFLIYRCMWLNGAKFSTGNEIAIGDTVVVQGELINFNGTPETKQGAKIISVNGKGNEGSGGETGDGDQVEPAGEGTAESPYNVAKALALTNALPKDGKSDNVYVEGTIVGTPEIDTGTYGNATYNLSDGGSSTVTFKIFRGYAFNGDKFTAANQLKEGDKVVVYGQLLNYFGNTPEMAQGNKLISVNGKTEFENTGGETGGNENPGGEGVTGEEMIFSLINSGVIGSITLETGKYGKQNTSDESTWYTWKFNDITYKGAKICLGDGTWGEGLQMQGNATDASKQGFLFNADPFSKDIKSVVVVMSVKKSSTYAPNYSFYVGDSAHPTTNSLTAEPTSEDGEGEYKYYTYNYDLSSGSYKYFTIANDKVGASYIMKIVVTLK
jgi:hypothetical protein